MSRTILVIDDTPIIRDPIAATLSGAGYRALRAANGQEALHVLDHHLVDLILLDVHMPVMDGLTFLRTIRQRPVTMKTPVIMLTAAEDRKDILEAAKLGIRGYILKSHFSLRDLMTRVVQHFNGQAPEEPTEPELLPAATISAPSAADLEMAREAAAAAQKAARMATFGEVISMTESSRSNVTTLAEVVGRDPALAAQVLQVANKPPYSGFHVGSVASLVDALRIIGSSALKEIVESLAPAA